MLKKFRLSATAIYISLIIPLVTMYLLPLLYITILGKNKQYYKVTLLNISNLTYIIISIALIVSAYFIIGKKLYEIFYFTIGIIVSIISGIFQYKETLLFLEITAVARCILIASYLILILYLLLQNKKENSKYINKSNFENLD